MIIWTLFISFIALVSAYTPPTNQTWGPLLLPDTTHPVTQGQPFTIEWNPDGHPTKGVTVSLVLCRGPPTNCVLNKKAIVEGVPAGRKKYVWNVPDNLRPGKAGTARGNGMLIIVDGTGEFQYSTQFSVLAAKN